MPMAMEPKIKPQEKLKEELEAITKRQLSQEESFEAYFNLSNFFRVLKQMKKEADYGAV